MGLEEDLIPLIIRARVHDGFLSLELEDKISTSTNYKEGIIIPNPNYCKVVRDLYIGS